MPGTYAHLMVANEFRNPDRLMKIPGFPKEAAKACLRWFKFVELGAASPDYPYLAVDDTGAKTWADLMHHTHSGIMLREGSKLLRSVTGVKKDKCLAWLLGYASHVAADMTIHPVVELKVGPYEANKTAHRTCEMHQDVFIFRRLNVGDVGVADFLSSGIGACSSDDDNDRLDGDIVDFWQALLKIVYPDTYSVHPPDIHAWHRRFNEIVKLISAAGGHFLPCARHLAADCGLVYPAYDQVDRHCIEKLKVPTGTMNYDAVFDCALGSVSIVWSNIARGTFNGIDAALVKFGEWDLDTGKDQTGTLIFWRE